MLNIASWKLKRPDPPTRSYFPRSGPSWKRKLIIYRTPADVARAATMLQSWWRMKRAVWCISHQRLLASTRVESLSRSCVTGIECHSISNCYLSGVITGPSRTGRLHLTGLASNSSDGVNGPADETSSIRCNNNHIVCSDDDMSNSRNSISSMNWHPAKCTNSISRFC